MTPQQKALREALAEEAAATAKLEALEHRITEAEAERDGASAAADLVIATYKRDVGDHACGEPVDLVASKAALERATERFDDATLVVDALDTKLVEVQSLADAATQRTAAAREAVCMSLAAAAERRVRESAAAFARAQGDRFRLAATAAASRTVRGHHGEEPIPFTGAWGALLMSQDDEGLVAILHDAGVGQNLQPHGNPSQLSDRQLLSLDTKGT